MIKRPKSTDSEQELLKMQLEFMKEKEKNVEFQPAAKVVRLSRDPEESDARQSVFRKKRGLKTKPESSKCPENKFVLGDIVERSMDHVTGTKGTDVATSSVIAFPEVEKIDPTLEPCQGQSLFAKMRNIPPSKPKESKQVDFGARSFILDGKEANKIHTENLELLSQVSTKEIEEERNKLIETMSPETLEFLKSIRNKSKVEPPAITANDPSSMDTDVSTPAELEGTTHLIRKANEGNWVNFDKIETDKLKWMQDVEPVRAKTNNGNVLYEARFDWKGVLLPYSQAFEEGNRDLFLHGDEPERAGYTLQELFRLARSDVLQQRIMALGAIQRMLLIFNQGFYDQVLELPITKIFFLLRFALDDQVIGVVEQAAQGLANLFYNVSDEFLLDYLYETKMGKIEPEFIAGYDSDINNRMKRLYLKNPMDSDAMSNTTEVDDFYLAEKDLVQCALRTNILNRIRYIIKTLKPSSNVVEACVQILIRIARHAKSTRAEIDADHSLVEALLEELEDGEKRRSNRFIVKLFRIISATMFVNTDTRLLLLERIKEFLLNRDDVNVDQLHLQIEAMRLLRIFLQRERERGDQWYNSILPTLRYYLEWHYQYLDMRGDGQAAIRQHAAAIIVLLLSCRQFCFDYNMCSQALALCCRKWIAVFGQMISTESVFEMEFSRTLLLTAIAEVCTDNSFLYQAIKKDLLNLIAQERFPQRMLHSLTIDSGLLTFDRDRQHVLPSLRNLGAITFDSKQKVNLIIPQQSGTMLINALIKLFVKDTQFTWSENVKTSLRAHLEVFAERKELIPKMNSNWFLRHNLDLIYNLVQLDMGAPSEAILGVSGSLLTCFYVETDKMELLLDKVLFNPNVYSNKASYSDEDILAWRNVFLHYYRMRKNETETDDKLFPLKWPYEMLNIFYDQHVETTNHIQIESATEDRLIRVSMGMTTLLEKNGVHLVSNAEKVVHLMMPHLSNEISFMDPPIKQILVDRAAHLDAIVHGLDFKHLIVHDNFDFESFYTVFLNQFQGSGYGDPLFSALVMVPLAVQHDIKFRKMVWGEHVAVLRFVTCTEESLLFNKMTDFLAEPKGTIKEDPNYQPSLINAYNMALKSNLLRPGSIPHRIAQFYVDRCKTE